MNGKGVFSAFALTSLFAATAGCLPQNTQTQGLHANSSNQLANANSPCTPSATSSLIATGRSLLEITNSLVETRQSFSDTPNTLQNVEAAQKINKGQNVLNNFEALAGGPTEPCS
jgi:hypothetical protein